MVIMDIITMVSPFNFFKKSANWIFKITSIQIDYMPQKNATKYHNRFQAYSVIK